MFDLFTVLSVIFIASLIIAAGINKYEERKREAARDRYSGKIEL
jgi:hypothetical protein